MSSLDAIGFPRRKLAGAQPYKESINIYELPYMEI